MDRRDVLKRSGVLASLGMAGIAGCTGSKNDSSSGGSPTPTATDTPNPTPTEPPNDLPRGGHMDVGFGQSLQSMSPFKGYQADYIAKEVMYSRLTTVDRNLEVHPDLAKDWTTNEDFTEWTFNLRKGVTFPNTGGEELTAADVEATIAFMRSDKAPNAQKDLGPLKKFEVVDDYTVKFTLKHPDTEYHRRISETGSTFCICPKSVLEGDHKKLESTDYGTGPFVLTTWKKGNKMVFKAKDNYHLKGLDGKPLPYLDSMTWQVTTDPIARVNSLTDQRVDSLSRISPNMIERAKKPDHTKVQARASGLQLPIVLNTTIEPFAKPKVRKAIKYATDRKQLLEGISNRGQLGHHDPITPIHKFYDGDLPVGHKFGTSANVKKAKSLLKEAGYGDGLKLPTLYYDGGVSQKESIAQLFQQQMLQAGIEFEIKRITESKWLSEYWNKDDVWYISNWSTRVVDSTIPLLALHSDGPWNTTRWSNSNYDSHLDKAVNATNVETRKKHLAKCQEICHTEGPWLSTVFLDVHGAYNTNVKNYRLYPTYVKDYLSECAVTDSKA